jgi:hypothetical protein
MTGFIEESIDLKVPIEGEIRELLSPIHYYSRKHKVLIKVPIGLKTDLGSIPQMLQGIFPKDGKAMFAYILHDYLYKIGKFTRSESDDILENAMKRLGVGWGTRKSVRTGLALGGWVAWNKHREKEKT